MAEHLLSDITRRLADFGLSLGYDDLPPQVIVAAKKGVLDTLGVALVGSREDSTRMIRRAFEHPDSRGAATILGTGIRTSPIVAAFVNGSAAHALDYDDTQHNCATHMSAPVLPAALAAAEMLQRPGKDLLTAYVVGFESGCQLARVAEFGRHLQRRGVHPTGFLGHIGAVAAAGKLMGLDALQMKRCFGIAASQAAGLLRSHGTMCKSLHAGNAAQGALLSAMLAKQGFTGAEDIFDGEQNIFAVYDGQTDAEELGRRLGQQFEIMENTIKAFACAGWRNPVVEALIQVAVTHELKPKDVKKVRLWAWTEVIPFPNYPEPRTGLEGKFSTQHAAAVALTDRAGGVAQFTDERVADAVLAELRRRVTVEADAKLEPYQIRVLVHTVDGRELSHFIPAQKGDPRNPLDWSELVAKFRANAMAVLPKGQVNRLAEVVWGLETVADISELTRLCRPSQVPI